MGISTRHTFLRATAVAAMVVAAVRAQPDPGSLAQIELLQETLAAVADQVRPSLVAIRAERRLDRTPETAASAPLPPDDENHQPFGEQVIPSVGSGVIISEDGLILTNEHVVHDAEPDAIECVLASGERYTVQGITTDPRSDLAVLRIDAKSLVAAPLGDAGTVRQGHFAIVMGNPYGSASDGRGRPVMSFGVISGLGRDLTGKLSGDRYYGNLLQTDARINPGNSGGPLVSIKGEVIGVITAILSRSGGSEGVGYAIAIDKRTKAIIAQLERGEEVEYGYLGIVLAEPTAEARQRAGGPEHGGALIEQIRPDTPAAAAHLRPGDVVVEFGGEPVDGVDGLIRLVGAAPAAIGVDVTLFRDGGRTHVTVTPGRRREVIRGVNVEVPFSWRGMTLENPTAQVRARFSLADTTMGVVVTRVDAGGVADKAGLEPGWVIHQVGDDRIRGIRRLRQMARDLAGPVRIAVEGEGEILLATEK